MFLPHMSGAGCPIGDPLSRGAFVGLNGFATRGDLLRAVVEGLDYQFADMLTALRDDLSVPFDRLVVVGGAVKNRFWMQNKADIVGAICGKAVEAPEIDEATPLGAAMLAGIGVGLYRDHEDAYQHVHRPGACYEADGAAARRYAELYPIYKQLYGALRGVNHQLSRQFQG